MTDVRLTATNPEDSSVVPVACNAKGELLLEEPTLPGDDFVARTGDNMTGDLTIGPDGGTPAATLGSNGNAFFVGTVKSGTSAVPGTGSGFRSYTHSSDATIYIRNQGSGPAITSLNGSETSFTLMPSGSATFASDVVVGSRSKKWMIVESNGLAHLVEQTRSVSADVPDDESATKYPELRNIPQELDLVEKALGEVMEKLRMNPPAGWPVWDGSDEI